jgi:AcrR family transcriptional regulator
MSPRGEAQNARMREVALAKLEDAALQEFAQHGYRAATMRRIAQASGVSHSLAYHYFASKDAIFSHLVDAAMSESLEGMRGAMGAPGTAWERIERYASVIVASVFESRTSLRFLIVLQAITQGRAVPGLLDRVAAHTQAYYDLFVPVIQEAQRAGDASSGDPEALAATFFSCVQGLASLAFQHSGVEAKVTDSMLLNVLRRGERE